MSARKSGRFNPIPWLTPFLLIGLLVFPATCTEASMVHSIFMDPATLETDAHRHETHAEIADAYGMSETELDEHIALGHIVIPEDAMVPGPVTVEPAEVDPCLQAPRVRSLPTEMMINVSIVAAVKDDSDGPDLNFESVDTAHDLVVPSGAISAIEIPPPR